MSRYTCRDGARTPVRFSIATVVSVAKLAFLGKSHARTFADRHGCFYGIMRIFLDNRSSPKTVKSEDSVNASYPYKIMRVLRATDKRLPCPGIVSANMICWTWPSVQGNTSVDKEVTAAIGKCKGFLEPSQRV